MTDMRDHVRRYLATGRNILPVRAGAKATRFLNWPTATATIDDFAPDDNVAERLDSIVDVDPDCRETRLVAPMLLLATGRIHARPSTGPTHYWFDAPGSKAEVFKDVDSTVLIEIRTGNRQYTLIPPSVILTKGDDPQPETLYWDADGEPARVDPDGLRQRVLWIAAAALAARHWPKGSRHVASGLLAGFLAARKLDPATVERIVRAAATAAGDEEVDDRGRFARASAEKFGEGITPIGGGPKLAEIMGEAVVARLRQWFGVKGDRTLSDGTHPLTEAGDADAFAASKADCVRYDHRQGRWLITNDAGLWVPDRTDQITQLALSQMRERQQHANAITNDAVRRDVKLWTVRGEARKRIANLLAFAQSVAPLSDSGDQWDVDPWLLGVQNGVVDLRTRELRKAQPEDRITMQARVAYDPAATCPLWESTVRSIFDGDDDVIGFVQRAFGYSLTGDCREECFFMNWGVGANGKGTLMNTLAWVLGDYADNLSFSALELHDRSAGASPDIAKLVGKRFVTASESGEVRLNEARVKAITGRDPITARFLYHDEFTFQPDAKFWLATNMKPQVRDSSEGFWRRVHLVPFTQTFVGREDRTLKDRLREEAAGILRWAIDGCIAWQRDGLNPPAVVRNATADYRRENEQLTRFIEAQCEIRDGARVQADPLWRAFGGWCERMRERASLNQTTFGQAIKKMFEVDQMKKRHVVYLGLQLRSGSGEILM